MKARSTAARASPALPVADKAELRRARIEAIRQAAIVRANLGQAALHRLVDGRHVVNVRGKIVVADDLQEAIRLAKQK